MFQINQSNLHLLLPGKISWLVEYYTKTTVSPYKRA